MPIFPRKVINQNCGGIKRPATFPDDRLVTSFIFPLEFSMSVTSEPALLTRVDRLRQVASLLAHAFLSLRKRRPVLRICAPDRPLESRAENLDPTSDRSMAANLPWRPQPASAPPTCHHVAHVGPCRERNRESNVAANVKEPRVGGVVGDLGDYSPMNSNRSGGDTNINVRPPSQATSI